MWNRILYAIEKSDSRLLRFYLRRNPDLVFEQNYQNETLLHFAARLSSPEIITELIKHGARTDVQDEFGWTPLHEACNSCNEEAVLLMLQTGTNPNIFSRKQETPLHLAARKNATGIMVRLINAGAKKQLLNRRGDTPLHLAAAMGLKEASEVLLLAKANPSLRNLDGYAPLHLAATKGHLKCATILLQYGADPDQPDHKGRSFLDIAGIFGKTLFVKQIASSKQKSQTSSSVNPSDQLAKFQVSEPVSPVNRARSYFQALIDGLIWGHASFSRSRPIMRLTELLLWFVVFPMLIYALFQSFYSGMLPPLIRLNHVNFGGLIQHGLSTILVFMLSYFLISTEIETVSVLHFFKDLREAIHFRVLHFLLIDLAFCHDLSFNLNLLGNFLIFWTIFLLLYVLSYLFWWTDVYLKEAMDSEFEAETAFQ